MESKQVTRILRILYSTECTVDHIPYKISFMIFLCFNCSPFFYFQVLDQKMHYGTTVLYCVVYFHLFYFHFFPYPRKLNDNEKLWIYGKWLFARVVYFTNGPSFSISRILIPRKATVDHIFLILVKYFKIHKLSLYTSEIPEI